MSVQGELLDLTESELSDVSGEGIGLVYENYQFEMKDQVMGGATGNSFKITGIKDGGSPTGADAQVTIGHYYFAGAGSAKGTALDGKLVNIGRLNNPITIDQMDGNSIGGSVTDKAVLNIAMPTHVDQLSGYHCTDPSQGQGTGTCSSRSNQVIPGFHGERFDMGMKINRVFDPTSSSSDVNLNFHAQSANMDGSYMRLWGGSADVDGDSIDDTGLMLESQINFYAHKLIFDSCDLDGTTNCGSELTLSNFSMELALGDAKFYQPMTIDVSDDGFLHIMIQPLPSPGDSRLPGTGSIGANGALGTSDAATWNWYNDYYENGRKTNISVTDLSVGASSFGSSSIQGMQIQYLEVLSHEI
jgi:hypothetical protein